MTTHGITDPRKILRRGETRIPTLAEGLQRLEIKQTGRGIEKIVMYWLKDEV